MMCYKPRKFGRRVYMYIAESKIFTIDVHFLIILSDYERSSYINHTRYIGSRRPSRSYASHVQVSYRHRSVVVLVTRHE